MKDCRETARAIAIDDTGLERMVPRKSAPKAMTQRDVEIAKPRAEPHNLWKVISSTWKPKSNAKTWRSRFGGENEKRPKCSLRNLIKPSQDGATSCRLPSNNGLMRSVLCWRLVRNSKPSKSAYESFKIPLRLLR